MPIPMIRARWFAALFFLLNLPRVLHHAMWRDELQAWQIARHSDSLAALFHNLRYEGHPALWHLLLWPLSHATADPRVMAVAHLAIATAVATLLFAASPFRPSIRWLLPFGYFFLYEYLLLSRGYSLGVLFVLLFCWLTARRAHVLARAACLFLLCQCSIFGAFLALSLWLYTVLRGERDRVLGVALTLGVALMIVQVMPPADSGNAPPWYLTPSLSRLATTLPNFERAFTLWPLFDDHARQGRIIDFAPAKLLSGLSIAIALLCVRALRPSRPAMITFCAGSLAIFAFEYAKWPGHIRHHGTFFVLFLACLWFRQVERSRVDEPRGLFGLAAYQALVGVVMSLVELVQPISAARATAEFLRTNGYTSPTLVGESMVSAVPVAAYLDAPFYFVQRQELGTFAIHDDRNDLLNEFELLDRTRAYASTTSRPVLLVRNRPLKRQHGSAHQIAAFTDALYPSERFYLYTIDPTADR